MGFLVLYSLFFLFCEIEKKFQNKLKKFGKKTLLTIYLKRLFLLFCIVLAVTKKSSFSIEMLTLKGDIW